jgi:predicted DsbA family dithiol-disulfide isomerase
LPCENIGDHAVLMRIASEVGMDDPGLAEKLQSGKDEDKVAQLVQESAVRGVSGVPFFIINGRYGLSGAQPADSLVAALDQIAAEDTNDT